MHSLTQLKLEKHLVSQSSYIFILLLLCFSYSTKIKAQSNTSLSISATKTIICKGQTSTLSAQGTGTFLWSNGSTTKSITVKPDVTTTYSVTCTNTQGIKTGSILITVNPLPIAIINSANRVCPNVAIPISAENAGAGATYTWNFSTDGNPATATGIGPHNVSFSSCNSRTISLVVAQNGCTTMRQKLIKGDDIAPTLKGVPSDMTVNVLPPTPNVTATDNCDKDVSIVFTETYTVSGCDRIGLCKWTATDDCGNTATATMRLTIKTLFTLYTEVSSNYFPYQPYPSATGTQLSKLGANDGKATVNIVSGGVSPFSYKWSNGETTQTAQNLSAGTHYVTVTDANNCTGVSSVLIKSPAKLGDYIFLDNNLNGIQDAADAPLIGAIVTLLGTDQNGAAVSTNFTTGTDGKYVFDGLLPGTYRIKVSPPTGSNVFPTLRDQGLNDDFDSDIDGTGTSQNVTLNNNTDIRNLDAGFCPAWIGQIGDFVWLDKNGDGIQDLTETAGVPNIQVFLTGPVNRNTTTDANGKYLFSGLPSGVYRLQFNIPGTYNISSKDKGSDDALDSDANAAGVIENVNLGLNEVKLTLDVGLYKLASLGDFVWEDTNKNGIQDAGEVGIPNVTVLLDGTMNDGSTFTQRSTGTTSTGEYAFYNLQPGKYKVKFNKPTNYTASPANQGTDNQKDSDANINTGIVNNITINSGANNKSIDAGFYKEVFHSCVIGDFVWFDCNKNGIQDFGEYGIPNVLVQLKKTNGVVVATTQTATNGFYNFNNIAADTYILCFLFPSSPLGLGYSPKDQGSNDALDSDVNPNGCTDPIVVNSLIINTIDAGMTDILAPTLVNIPANITVECDNIPAKPTDVYAIDNLDPTPDITCIESKTNGICNYKIIRTWIAKDDCGNQCAHIQEITVLDSKAPVLTVPNNLTIECHQQVPLGLVTAIDNCDPNPIITYIGEVGTAINGKVGVQRTWQATDRCGNSSQATQFICYIDQSPPVFVNPPLNVTVECDAIPSPWQPDVNDNCDALGINVVYNDTRVDGNCRDNYVLTRTWRATDSAGNSTSVSQTIVVQDTTPPQIIGAPTNDITLNCGDAIPTMPIVTATDNCDASVTKPTLSELIFQGTCSTSVGGQAVETNHVKCQWVATDRCGNVAIKVWNIYIIGGNTSGGSSKIIASNSSQPTDKQQVMEKNKQEDETTFAYPNPTKGDIYIHNRQAIVQTQVIDLNGRIVYDNNQTQYEDFTLDFNHLQVGNYQLRMKNADGKWIIQRISLVR